MKMSIFYTDDRDCGGTCKETDYKITNDQTGTVLKDRFRFVQVRLKTVLTYVLRNFESYWSLKLFLLSELTSPPKVTPI